jgi:limonene-1,2-epoxide hydrolase
MAYFKDQQNNLHFLSAEDIAAGECMIATAVLDADGAPVVDDSGNPTYTYAPGANRSLALLPPGSVELTADEVAALNVAAAAAEASAELQDQARQALSKSDTTVLRCFEVGEEVPSAWKAYRANLREIIASGTGTMPTRPTFPAGT